MIILQVLGAVFLAIIVIILAIFVYIRFWFCKAMGGDHNHNEPLKIHLIEDVMPDWLDEQASASVVSALQSLGFTKDKSYSVQEMPADVLFFYKGDIIAALCRHQMVKAVWVDFVVNTLDGKEYTVSNVPMGSNIDYRPECIKYVDKAASVASLYDRIEKITEEHEIQPVDPSTFRALFEEAYKADMAWRAKQGGMSFEEFVSETEELSKKKTKNLAADFTCYKVKELDSWHYPALEAYSESLGNDKDELDDSLHSCFIVPYKAHLPAFLEYLEDQGFIEDDQTEKFEKAFAGEEDNYVVFERINALFSPDIQAKLVTTQDYPLPLRIYRQP